MTDPENNPAAPDQNDDRIRRLVLLLEEGADDGAPRPPDEALEAFLTGSATAQQQVQVLNALEHSRAYRKEVAEIAADLEELLERRRLEPKPDDSEELPEVVRKRIEDLPSGKIYRIRGITSLLAAAALIITTVILVTSSGDKFKLAAQSIERSELISLHSRSATTPTTIVYQSEQEAAVAAFRRALIYDNAAFMPRYPEASTTSGSSDETRSITVRHPSTNRTLTYNADLPPSVAVSSNAVFYALALPSRDLYSLEAGSGSISADWRNGRTDYLCVTLVFPIKDGFGFSPARVFSTK